MELFIAFPLRRAAREDGLNAAACIVHPDHGHTAIGIIQVIIADVGLVTLVGLGIRGYRAVGRAVQTVDDGLQLFLCNTFHYSHPFCRYQAPAGA